MATPLDPTALLAAGAAPSARALAAGQLSAAALCEAAIARIEAIDGALNAVVVRDFDRARRQAAEADAALARGERRPLLGVPMTVKEAFNVAGLPTSWGLPQFRDFVPQQDAVAVARLKAAGAVILGKTNVPPGLADWQSANPVYGRTVHPLDAGRTPGGSSGGGAVAVATGMVALELGSDLTGSLRVPASFCGVYAHKPSHGLLPARGFAFPGTEEALASLPSVIGPIGHGAEDLSLALDVLAGPDAAHVAQGRFMLPAARHAAAKDWRVLVVTAHPQAAVAADVRAAVEGAGRRLAKAGASVAQASDLLPDLAEIGDTYGQIVQTVLAHAEPGGRSPMQLRTWFDLLATRTRIRAQLRAVHAIRRRAVPGGGLCSLRARGRTRFREAHAHYRRKSHALWHAGGLVRAREPGRPARHGRARGLHGRRIAAGRADRRPVFRGSQHPRAGRAAGQKCRLKK